MNLHYGRAKITHMESCYCILQEKNVTFGRVRLHKGVFCKLFFDLHTEVLVHIQDLWSDSYKCYIISFMLEESDPFEKTFSLQ